MVRVAGGSACKRGGSTPSSPYSHETSLKQEAEREEEKRKKKKKRENKKVKMEVEGKRAPSINLCCIRHKLFGWHGSYTVT